MGTTAAPRIDDRLRRFIAGSSRDETAAAVTRRVGALAGDLQLARPSYQQVRVLLNASRANGAAHLGVMDVLEFLYQYPGPGMADWYERWKHGEG